MSDVQRAAVHVVGKDRLGMKGVDQVDTLVITSAAVEGLLELIRTMQHRIAGVHLEPCPAQHSAQRHTGPLRNSAPTFHTIVPGDLRFRWEKLDLRE